ncbi:MAG: CDP-diacylglycerol--glycerol-3-phosphate 3-phosphatidyltransferase [Clostridiales bacterium]|nr:CDP-diacylglycerol--glycerol-3-phosphate 3-phosphatidyltransferase [Clostridiales bacterium]
MKNIPNILTLVRLLLVPVFPILYFSSDPNALIYALIIFIIAGVTDLLDGYIARKFDFITQIGIVFDPLADKLMLLTALTCLYIDTFIPLWVLLVMYIKELFMIIAGLILFFKKEKEVMPANVFGKLATMMFSLAVVLILISPNTNMFQYLIFLAVSLKLLAFSSYVISHIRYSKSHKHPNNHPGGQQ